MKNYLKVGRYSLVNSIAIDGCVFIARDERIVWSRYLPDWAITAYCWLARVQ